MKMFRHKLILILILLCGFSTKAQLDLEHWFPPVFNTGGAIYGAVISLSTDKEDPFDVYIYSSNTFLDKVIISKNNPIEYKIKDLLSIYTGDITESMKPINKGIHLAGKKSFYANLKLAGDNTEIISSKGKTALGKSFLIVNDQIILYGCPTCNAVLMDYQASITAFSDNTHIKIKGYGKGLVFTDRSNPDELNITLNKNESYMVVAKKIDNTSNVVDAIDVFDPTLIGASITSDKLIVVNNGNNLSQDLGNMTADKTGSVNIDQSLPISKLGKEYFFINGMSTTNAKMEKAVIVALEDDTQIFFNNETTPFITLQKGYRFIGPYGVPKFLNGAEDSFVNEDGRTIKTTGMFIRSSKPIYCYQMIGTFYDFQPGNYRPMVDRTSAMLFSYPLDVNYQVHSVTLSQVDKIGIDDYRRSKISIKSEKDAVTTVNGVPLDGGTDIIGKPGWKYNTIIGSVGNIEIKSDKSLNVDFVGGGKPDRRGGAINPIMSGYAASVVSYSNDPSIIKNGACVQEEVLLSLTNTDFEGFQWQRNGVNITGAINSTYTPLLPGDYTCKCFYAGIFYTTPSVNVTDCPYSVSTTNLGNICPNFSIIPKFSPPNTSLVTAKIEITSQPFYANATLINDQIKVSNTTNYSGPDRLIYRITATNGYYETVKVEFTLLPLPIGDIAQEIMPSAVISSTYYYNLNTIIINQNGEEFHFYETQSDAENNANEIIILKDYIATSNQVFVKITNSNGCIIIKPVALIKPPVADVILPNVFTPNGDGINDVWNYSLLNKVLDLNLKIFDRYGKVVFERQPNSKSFTWDGREKNGNKLPTSTYWVFATFRIEENGVLIIKTQWLLLKNI